MLTLALLLGLTAHPCWAFVPMSCTSPESLGSMTCCPAFWADGSPCGRASRRGECRDVRRPDGAQPGHDFRGYWPVHLFTRLCRCDGNFWGVDCGECKPGWAGGQCDRAVPPVYRPDCSSLPPFERWRLISALHVSKTTYSDRWTVYRSVRPDRGGFGFRRASLFDAMSWAHYLTAKNPLDRTGPRYGHGSVGFLTWHRLYLNIFERELRNLTGDPNVALCAWKWSGKSSCDICTPDYFGANDGRGNLVGNFANWSSICSGPSSSTPSMSSICPEEPETRIERRVGNGRLPLDIDLERCLQASELDSPPFTRRSGTSFRNILEGFINPRTEEGNGMHNRVHVYIGGFMASIYMATNDPIFYPVHCEMDRIFETWLEGKDRSTVYPRNPEIVEGHLWNDNILPFLPLVTNQEMLAPTHTLGYTYRRPPWK